MSVFRGFGTAGFRQRTRAMMIKEFIQLRRDRVSFAMIVMIPLMQLILFGYAINTTPRDLPTAVLLQETSDLGRSIVAALENTRYFRVTHRLSTVEEFDAVIRRGEDLFGSTVNVAARLAAIAAPGQLLATSPVAAAASARGILVRELGATSLRSLAAEIALYEIELAPAPDPAWIDPVCKMHAPYESYRRAASPDGPWFCSKQCEEAFRKSPQTYKLTIRI